jgi:hypothetical protein
VTPHWSAESAFDSKNVENPILSETRNQALHFDVEVSTELAKRFLIFVSIVHEIRRDQRGEHEKVLRRIHSRTLTAVTDDEKLEKVVVVSCRHLRRATKLHENIRRKLKRLTRVLPSCYERNKKIARYSSSEENFVVALGHLSICNRRAARKPSFRARSPQIQIIKLER